MTDKPKYLGKYEILAEIGKGGFATVYRARDPDLDRVVALKVLDPLLTRDPVWVARFRREARAVARLDHPHVVTIYEVGEAEGLLYLAARLVEGGHLGQRLAQQGPFAWSDVVRLVGEIAAALDYAHEQGVVHRDLKAANVLLDEERGALLTDFGFASIVSESSYSISVSGGVVGTPQYIAPEVWEGETATAQTDVYALSCIVYEMVMGEHLFRGDTTPSIMRAHFKPLALPDEWPEGVPAGLVEVLERALAKEPAARFHRAGDLAQALAELREDTLAAPYAALEAAVAGESWEEALALSRQIQANVPDYRDVAALEEQALEGLEQAARRREAAIWREEAERALAEGDLQGAEMAARRWLGLTPDDPAASVFLARLVLAAPVELGSIQELPMANASAGRRSSRPQRRSRRLQGERLMAAADESPRRAIAMLKGKRLMVAAGEVLQRVIAMLKGRAWGRELGLGGALLFEVVGLIAGWGILVKIALDGAHLHEEVSLTAGALASVVASLAGFGWAILLGRDRVIRGLQGAPRQPAGIRPIAALLAITGVGIAPAAGLLKRKRWARVVTLLILLLFALLAGAGGAVLGTDSYIYWHEKVGSTWVRRYCCEGWALPHGIAVGASSAICCLWAFVYLLLPSVRAWFRIAKKTK